MSIMELPETFQNQKLEVIILPVEECEYTEESKSQTVYQNIQKFRKQGEVDRDYKSELYTELEEKYKKI